MDDFRASAEPIDCRPHPNTTHGQIEDHLGWLSKYIWLRSKGHRGFDGSIIERAEAIKALVLSEVEIDD